MAHFWPLCLLDGSDMHEKKKTATNISVQLLFHSEKNYLRWAPEYAKMQSNEVVVSLG